MGCQPPPATAPGGSGTFFAAGKHGKKRGSYNCGRCGLPKKGHSCHVAPSDDTPSSPASSILPRQANPNFGRRALSFDESDAHGLAATDDVGLSDHGDGEFGKFDSGLPPSCLWEILRRMPPAVLLAAARVCKGWRETAKKVWKAAEELRFRVPSRVQIGFVGSVLQKCPSLVRLTLRMESDMDATMLACIAFSCPNLELMEISTADTATSRITGEELGRFVADKRCLTSLKMEGCSSLGGFILTSSSLSTLWLSDLHSLNKMIFNCPNLKELSLNFSCQQNDCTDLPTMMDGLGRSCPKLQSMHIASFQLSHAAVLALAAANLRGLRMLSLVLGPEITDASVAAITSSYSNLELLDLSGSSITDGGISMICNVIPQTLSSLLLALCPNITSNGIQFATAQLPHLELMDCGMSICDPNCQTPLSETTDNCTPQISPNSKPHLIYQKLIIKHDRLKKVSLWGCSGLDALYLNCPQLEDLNLNSCKNLHPERLMLQCPQLESVHASGCQDMLISSIHNQVLNDRFALEDHFPSKRMSDGSKRVRVPHFLSQSNDNKKKRKISERHCKVIV